MARDLNLGIVQAAVAKAYRDRCLTTEGASLIPIAHVIHRGRMVAVFQFFLTAHNSVEITTVNRQHLKEAVEQYAMDIQAAGDVKFWEVCWANGANPKVVFLELAFP
jgi:hypothetical protein